MGLYSRSESLFSLQPIVVTSYNLFTANCCQSVSDYTLHDCVVCVLFVQSAFLPMQLQKSLHFSMGVSILTLNKYMISDVSKVNLYIVLY